MGHGCLAEASGYQGNRIFGIRIGHESDGSGIVLRGIENNLVKELLGTETVLKQIEIRQRQWKHPYNSDQSRSRLETRSVDPSVTLIKLSFLLAENVLDD